MRDLIAATPGWLMVALALVVWALIYIAECCWFQFKPCRSCKGKGRHYREDRKVHRDCWRCRGRGRKLRLGRKVWNRFAKVRKASA